VAGLWFSPGTLVSSTNKTDHHDTTEILLKVVLSTINQTNHGENIPSKQTLFYSNHFNHCIKLYLIILLEKGASLIGNKNQIICTNMPTFFVKLQGSGLHAEEILQNMSHLNHSPSCYSSFYYLVFHQVQLNNKLLLVLKKFTYSVNTIVFKQDILSSYNLCFIKFQCILLLLNLNDLINTYILMSCSLIRGKR